MISNALWLDAIRLLARREHSAYELKQKLLKKGYLSDSIDKNIERLQQQAYQSDERFIESYINHRMKRGFGPVRILQELKSRGIDEPLAKKVIAGQKINWVKCAYAVWQKKFADSCKETVKQKRFLFYRGFDSDTISTVIKDRRET